MRDVPWLEPGQNFPPTEQAWGETDPVPGLLAAGGALDVFTLQAAYSQAVFPWYGAGQPILWWSPNPRMVLRPTAFKLHRSLRKTLQTFLVDPACSLRVDTAFTEVIQACADSARPGQDGTWIVPDMVAAYLALHRAGFAHSVECWINNGVKDELVGGLYCVAIGQAVFGESMFSRRSDASKLALCALVALCRAQGVVMIDCQQDTPHLTSLGGQLLARADFVQHVQSAAKAPALKWGLEPVYWNTLFHSGS